MARRLNKGFAIGLTTAVLAAGLLLVFAKKMKLFGGGTQDVKTLVAKGDAEMAAGKYEQAAAYYKAAAGAESRNANSLVKWGDALAKRMSEVQDQREMNELMQQANGHWRQAVANDPRCVDAINRLIDSQWEYADLFPPQVLAQWQTFQSIREMAGKLADAEPGNARAPVMKCLATLRQDVVLNNVPKGEIAEAARTAPELIRRNPTNADLPFFLALWKIQEGEERLVERKTDVAAPLFVEAGKIFDDARAAQPANALIQFRAFQIYSRLAAVERRSGNTDAADKFKTSIDAAIAAARANTKPGERSYDDIQATAAATARARGNVAEAEKIIGEYYAANPNNQRARLEQAKVLAGKGGKDLDEAVRILSLPVEAPADVGGVRVLLTRALEADTRYQLTRIRLDELNQARAAAAGGDKDAAARIDALEKAADAEVEKMKETLGKGHFRSLEVQGLLELSRGRVVEAIRPLAESVGQHPGIDPDLSYQLARAYVFTKQPGHARAELEQRVLKAAPGWAAPRALLVELLLNERRVDQAREQLKVLEKIAPDAEELKKLRSMMALMNHESDPQAALQAFASLPASTREEKLRKAMVARQIENYTEAVNLLEGLRAADPTDVPVAHTLADVYLTLKPQPMKSKALQVLREAQAKNPEDATLPIRIISVETDDPAAVDAKILAEIAKIQDEFTRNQRFCEFHARKGNMEESFKYLEKAAQVAPAAPTDPVEQNKVRWVLERYFQHYVMQRDYTKAEEVVDRAATANADQVSGLLYRQRLAMARGDLQAADEVHGLALVSKYPEFAASWLALGQAQQARGKYAEAIKSYREVRKSQPNHYEATRNLIECHYQTAQLEDARILIIELQAAYPGDRTAKELALNHEVNFGDPLRAIKGRQEIIAENPKDPNAYLALAATYFQAAQNLAASEQEKSTENLKMASEVLEQGRKAFPDNTTFYAQHAEMLQYEGRVDEGLAVLGQLTQHPKLREDPQSWVVLAEYLARINRVDQAIGALNEALSRSKNDQNIRLRLSAAEVQREKYNEALTLLNGVANPSDPRVFRQRVEILIAKGDLPGAESALREELGRRNSADLRNLLASILIDTKKFDEALQQLALAQQVEPRNDMTRYLRALAMAKQGNADAAIKELSQVRDRSPRNVQVRLLLAELFEKTGRRDSALTELNEGLRRSPLNRDLRLGLINRLRMDRTPTRKESIQRSIVLAREAQMNPVLKTDPVWAREQALGFMLQKDPRNAVISMYSAIALAPGKVEYWRELLDMLLQLEKYDEVLRESEKVIAAKHDTWWVHYQRAQAMARLGRKQESLGEYDLAIARVDKAKQANLVEFILRGMAVSASYDEALSRVLADLGPDPTRWNVTDPTNQWRLLAASLYRGKGDFDNATKIVEVMLADPSNADSVRRPPILRAAADVYQNGPNKNYAKAQAAYIELLTLQQTDLISLNNLAYLYAESIAPPDPHKAKIYSQRAYDIVQVSPLTEDNRHLIEDTHGWVLTLCGGADAIRGLEILQRVVDQNKEFVEGRYHLGEALLRKINPDRLAAKKELTDARALLDQKEAAGEAPDKALRNKILDALARAEDRAGVR